MKFLVKKEICGSREQCMGPTNLTETHLLKKKKKESQNVDVEMQILSKHILSLSDSL